MMTRIDKGYKFLRGLKHPNLNPEEKLALIQLKNNKEIIIKPADKNLGLTIMDKSWYIQECLSQLSDLKVYEPNVLPDFKLLKSQVIKFATYLPPNESKFVKYNLDLRIDQQIIPEFYIIPKIHKPKLAGRPIVANHSFCLNQVSRWVDIKLQKVVKDKKCSTILSNSDQLRQVLDTVNGIYNPLNKFYTFITADVVSLYPNIPIDIGISYVSELLDKLAIYDREENEIIIQGLALVLNNSYLHFNGVVYHQIQGTAMGAPLAPCYANLFLFQFEQKWLSNPIIAPHVCIFNRYIDDIFILWFDSDRNRSTNLKDAIDLFNSYLPTIKITPDISTTTVNFLDLLIFKENFTCKYKTYKKSMNRYLYIPFSSYHTTSQKYAFIKAELLRLCRNSSSEQYFVEDAKFFRHNLLERGYSGSFLNLAFNQVSYSLRAQYLQPKVKSNTFKSSNIFVTVRRDPFIDKLPLLKSIKEIPESKFNVTIAKANPPSIRNALIRAKYT
jgi:hypothetical protein